MSFEEIKKDYVALIEKWGHPEDMTGGFVDAEKMEKVILNPSKAKAAEYLKDVIFYGFQFKDEKYRSEKYGAVSISTCKLLTRLYEKYIF